MPPPATNASGIFADSADSVAAVVSMTLLLSITAGCHWENGLHGEMTEYLGNGDGTEYLGKETVREGWSDRQQST